MIYRNRNATLACYIGSVESNNECFRMKLSLDKLLVRIDGIIRLVGGNRKSLGWNLTSTQPMRSQAMNIFVEI